MTDEAKDSLAGLFRRFLGFGLRAWGGPAAQIAMIRQELVERERWMESQEFNRTLAVYQALPGPEATELCVHFGYLRRGRIGGLLAGLGFVLPGFLLMLALSIAYVAFSGAPWWTAAVIGFPPAVAALVVRATHRLGTHALHDRMLLLIGAASMLATLLGTPFYIVLPVAGIAHMLHKRGWPVPALALVVAFLAVGLVLPDGGGSAPAGDGTADASLLELAWSGFKAGMLTFGGAYTVIPFLQADSAGPGGWVTQAEFIDAIALSGILPAPLIIFSTMLGYLGAGLLGAVVITVAIFLPAFAFTLIGYPLFDRLVNMPRVHAFLDGVTAAVIGLIAVVAILLAMALFPDWIKLALFAAALTALFMWNGRAAAPVVVLACGAIGAVVALT